MARTKRGNWKDKSGRKENFWLRLLFKARAQDYGAKKTFVKGKTWRWDAVKKLWDKEEARWK